MQMFVFDVSLFPELGLECLATWKDGSDTFFYGVFASEGLVTKEDTYRCFVSLLTWHEIIGSQDEAVSCLF
jgi:hypothetical protein